MNDTWYSCVVFSEIEVLLVLSSVAEAVKRPALSFESVDHVSCHDGLPLGVLGVGHRVPHHVLQEHAQHRPHLLVDESGDPLDAASPGQPPDGGLGDALDVVPQNLHTHHSETNIIFVYSLIVISVFFISYFPSRTHLSVPLSSSLAETLAPFPSAVPVLAHPRSV